MRRMTRYGLMLVLVCMTACGTSSPDEEVTTELQTIASWAATAHMVADAWTRGAVPTAYAKQSLQTAQQTLQDEAQTFSQSPAATTQRGAALLQALQQLERMLGMMAQAVEREDRALLATQIAQLTVEEQHLSEFGKIGGA